MHCPTMHMTQRYNLTVQHSMDKRLSQYRLTRPTLRTTHLFTFTMSRNQRHSWDSRKAFWKNNPYWLTTHKHRHNNLKESDHTHTITRTVPDTQLESSNIRTPKELSGQINTHKICPRQFEYRLSHIQHDLKQTWT